MLPDGFYTLAPDGETPVPARDVVAWGAWLHTAERHLNDTPLAAPSGELRVSTVFIGLDHNFRRSGPPVLWETMIFGIDGQPLDYQARYASAAAARAGHLDAVAWARAWLAARAVAP